MAEINNEQIGMIFDDATTLLVGGIDGANFQAITNDLKTVQTDMAAISAGDGEGLSITHKMRPPPSPSPLAIRESYESLVVAC